MLLTNKYLKNIQEYMGLPISESIKNELLNKFGNQLIDHDGHVFEYSEQDIYEQVRKILQNSKKMKLFNSL